MRALMSWAGIAAFVAVALALGVRSAGETGSPGERVESVAASLRCPVCQGLSVQDSDSPTARDLRADILRRLEAGGSPDEVRQAYVDRYGEWILLQPGSSGFEALVWAVPAAAAGAGAVVLVATFWRWRGRRVGRGPTDEDHRLVAAARQAARP